MTPEFRVILLTACIVLLIVVAIMSPVYSRLMRLLKQHEDRDEQDRLLWQTASNPGRYDEAGWPTVWSRYIEMTGDTMELNLARNALGTINDRLDALGIPHVQQIFSVGADSTGDVARLLDQTGAIELQTVARQYSKVTESPAADLPVDGPLARSVRILRVRVPEQFEDQAKDAVEAALQKSRDLLLRARA